MIDAAEALKILKARDHNADTAVLSPCATYRYELTRANICASARVLAVCGLNPSTADAAKDDNTIRKDLGFALRWGCGVLCKVNAEAYRTKDPRILKAARRSGVDTIGPENDAAIMRALEHVRATDGIFLIACGAHVLPARERSIAALVAQSGVRAVCLGTNDDGTPEHELYIPYERPARAWSPRA